MLSHIIGIVLIVLGILTLAYSILDAAKLNNIEENVILILILFGFLLISLGIFVFSGAQDASKNSGLDSQQASAFNSATLRPSKLETMSTPSARLIFSNSFKL